MLVDVASATLSCGFNGSLASNTTFYPVCKSLFCLSSAIFDNDTLGEACVVTGAEGHTTAGDAEVTLTCVFDPELKSMLLEGSIFSCKLAPSDICTLVPPSAEFCDGPNTVSGQSGTANCSDDDGALSGTAASAVSSDPTFPGPTSRAILIGDTCRVFCEAILYDLPTLTCACDSRENPVDWEDEVPICPEDTCDMVAAMGGGCFRVFQPHLQGNMCCSLFCKLTGESARRISESVGDSDGHLHRPNVGPARLALRRALRSDRWGRVRYSGANDSGLLSVAHGSSWTTIKEVADKTTLQHQMVGVRNCYEVVHALNTRAGGWESFSHTSLWSAKRVYGELTELSYSDAGDERDELARRSIIRALLGPRRPRNTTTGLAWSRVSSQTSTGSDGS